MAQQIQIKTIAQFITMFMVATASFSADSAETEQDELFLRSPVSSLEPQIPLHEFLRNLISPPPKKEVENRWKNLQGNLLHEAIKTVIDDNQVPKNFATDLTIEQARFLAWKTLIEQLKRYKDQRAPVKQITSLLLLARLILSYNYVPISFPDFAHFANASEWLIYEIEQIIQLPGLKSSDRKYATTTIFLLSSNNQFTTLPYPQKNAYTKWQRLRGNQLRDALKTIIDDNKVPTNFTSDLTIEEARFLAWDTIIQLRLHEIQDTPQRQMRCAMLLARLLVVWNYQPLRYAAFEKFDNVFLWLIDSMVKILESPEISDNNQKYATAMILLLASKNKTQNIRPARRQDFWQSEGKNLKSVVTKAALAKPESVIVSHEEAFAIVWERFLERAYKKRLPMAEKAGQILSLTRMFLAFQERLGDESVQRIAANQLQDSLTEIIQSPETELKPGLRNNARILLGRIIIRMMSKENDKEIKEAFFGVADKLFKEASLGVGSKKIAYAFRADLIINYGFRFMDDLIWSNADALNFADDLLKKSYPRASKENSSSSSKEGSFVAPAAKTAEQISWDQKSLANIASLNLGKSPFIDLRKNLFDRLHLEQEQLSDDEEDLSDENEQLDHNISQPAHDNLSTSHKEILEDDDLPADVMHINENDQTAESDIDWSWVIELADSLKAAIPTVEEEEDYADENILVQIGDETLNLTVLPASPKDHDCFFDALRQVGMVVTREQASELLLGMAHSEFFRDLLAPDILSVIHEGKVQLPQSLVALLDGALQTIKRNQDLVTDLHTQLFILFTPDERAVINTSLATFVTALSQMDDLSDKAKELLRKLIKAMEDTDKSRKDLESLVKQKNVYETFIKDFIAQRTTSKPDAPYNMIGLPLGRTGTVDAIAEVYGWHIQVIQGGRVIHERKPKIPNPRIVRLRYYASLHGVSHFDGLVELTNNNAKIAATSSAVQEPDVEEEDDCMEIDNPAEEKSKYQRKSQDEKQKMDAAIAKYLPQELQQIVEKDQKFSVTNFAKWLAERILNDDTLATHVRDLVRKNKAYVDLDSKYKLNVQLSDTEKNHIRTEYQKTDLSAHLFSKQMSDQLFGNAKSYGKIKSFIVKELGGEKNKTLSREEREERIRLIEEGLKISIEECIKNDQKLNAIEFARKFSSQYKKYGKPSRIRELVLESKAYQALDPKFKFIFKRKEGNKDSSQKSKIAKKLLNLVQEDKNNAEKLSKKNNETLDNLIRRELEDMIKKSERNVSGIEIARRVIAKNSSLGDLKAIQKIVLANEVFKKYNEKFKRKRKKTNESEEESADEQLKKRRKKE